MSIWASLPHIGFSEYDDEPQPRCGQVRSYAHGWSNHYPTTDNTVERDARIDLAVMPAWCADGSDDDFDSRGPWLRLCLTSVEHNYREPTTVNGEQYASVVLDEGAARELVEQLRCWIAAPKVARP